MEENIKNIIFATLNHSASLLTGRRPVGLFDDTQRNRVIYKALRWSWMHYITPLCCLLYT